MEPDAANPPQIELFSSKLHTFAPPCAAVWYGSKKLDGSVVFKLKFGSTVNFCMLVNFQGWKFARNAHHTVLNDLTRDLMIISAIEGLS